MYAQCIVWMCWDDNAFETENIFETTWCLNVITFYFASIKSMILATPLQILSDLFVHATWAEPSLLVASLST